MENLTIIDVKSRRDSYIRAGIRFSKTKRSFALTSAIALAAGVEHISEDTLATLEADPALVVTQRAFEGEATKPASTPPPAKTNDEVSAIAEAALKAALTDDFRPTKTGLEGVAKAVREALRAENVEFQKVSAAESDGVISVKVEPPGDADSVDVAALLPTPKGND
jgi:hypothetical protein